MKYSLGLQIFKKILDPRREKGRMPALKSDQSTSRATSPAVNEQVKIISVPSIGS